VPLGKFVAQAIRDAAGPSPDAGRKAMRLRVTQRKWLGFDLDPAEYAALEKRAEMGLEWPFFLYSISCLTEQCLHGLHQGDYDEANNNERPCTTKKLLSVTWYHTVTGGPSRASMEREALPFSPSSNSLASRRSALWALVRCRVHVNWPYPC
jgi:hypothetical protein